MTPSPTVDSEPTPLLVLRPPRGLARLNLGEVWQYREIVSTFALREIKLRYRQTALGVVWVVLQPLIAAGIANFVFGRIAGLGANDPGYFAKVYAGQLAWGLFGLTIFKISTSLMGNSAMLSKVFFPRLTLPLASALAAQLDFVIGLALLFFLMPVFHIAPGLALLTLPLWIAGLALMALGIGMMSAALMVSYRDVAFVLPALLNALNFLSPVFWPLGELGKHVPGHYHTLYLLGNPVAPLIEGLRWSLVGGTYPVSFGWVAYGAAMAVLLCLAGMMVFRNEERRFADVI